MSCTCRAAQCRGVVTGADWKRADLQHRYEGHWPPGLQQRIVGLEREFEGVECRSALLEVPGRRGVLLARSVLWRQQCG